MPMIMANRRHDHGPESRAARFQRGGQRVLALRELLARETDDQNAVGRGDAHAHDGAGEGGHGQRRIGEEQHPDDARQSRRKPHDDHERIDPGLEIDDDQKVDQDDRHRQTDKQLPVSIRHGARLPPNRDGRTFGQLRAGIVDDFLHVGGDAAEIPGLCGRIDIHDWPDIVVRDERVAWLGREGGEASQQLGGLSGGQRQVLEFSKRIDAVLRRLNGNRIGHAVFRVQPVGWRRLGAARQRRLDARGGIAFRQPDDAGEFAIEIDFQRRVLELLLDARIRDAGDVADLRKQLVRKGAAGAEVGAGDLNVERRRRAEIEDLGDDVSGKERESRAGKKPPAASRAGSSHKRRWRGRLRSS